MSNAEGPPRVASARPRVVFFGMPCGFSGPPLAALVASGHPVAAVVLPGPRDGEPLRWHRPPRRLLPTPPLAPLSDTGGGPTLMAVARAAGIPLLFVTSIQSGAAVAEVVRIRPDVIAVACFPERLPAALLRLPPLGALNVHPSLLPRDRGPSPLFWAFHRGAEETGVSIHLMEESLDTGPIVRQARVPIAEGARLADLERELATLGAELLVEAIDARAEGDLAASPQDPSLASAATFPTALDSIVDPASWSAERVVRFVKGVRSARVRLPNGDLVPVDDADRWESVMTPKTSLPDGQSDIVVAFPDGRVVFRRA